MILHKCAKNYDHYNVWLHDYGLERLFLENFRSFTPPPLPPLPHTHPPPLKNKFFKK